jgi:hypothetical protein
MGISFSYFTLFYALTDQPGGLRGEMASHADVEPLLDLGGQMKDFDSHGGSPLQIPDSRRAAGEPGDATGVGSHIGYRADRLQYLSVNIP